MKFYTVLLFALSLTLPVCSQKTLLNDERTLEVIYDGLTSMYNYDFEAATEAVEYVSNDILHIR